MQRSQLSRPQQSLIERCQEINFGRVSFRVRHGEPDVDDRWRTRRTVKLAGAENGPRSEANNTDFLLCKEQVSLLSELAQLADGVHVTIDVKHGLPFLIEIEQDHQVA